MYVISRYQDKDNENKSTKEIMISLREIKWKWQTKSLHYLFVNYLSNVNRVLFMLFDHEDMRKKSSIIIHRLALISRYLDRGLYGVLGLLVNQLVCATH